MIRTIPVALVVLGCAGESPAPTASPDVSVVEVVEVVDVAQEPDTPEAAPPASSPLGEVLCLAGTPGAGDLQAPAVARLGELGVSRIRTDLLWHVAEPSQGEWRLDKLDDRVGPYLDAGIDVIGLLAYGNPWATEATEDDAMYPPDDPADFATFVSAVVEHFSGRITDYEVWNEPNAGYRFWKPTGSGDPAAFGALLKAATAAGRLACAECRFAFGGPFYHHQLIDGHLVFLAAAQDAHPDLSSAYDAMGFHPYAPYVPVDAPEGKAPDFDWPVWAMADSVREVMAEQGAGDRPLWTTEVGWPVYGDVDAETQADYLVRSILHLTSNGATPVCWYNLFEGPDPESYPPEQAFGLLTRDDTPKPAFVAMKQLGTRFAAHRITRDLRATGAVQEPLWGYELDDGQSAWWVLWAYPASDPVTATLPGDALEALDAVGGEVEASGSTIDVGGRPVFVRMDLTGG